MIAESAQTVGVVVFGFVVVIGMLLGVPIWLKGGGFEGGAGEPAPLPKRPPRRPKGR